MFESGFVLKEAFKDITGPEVSFLSKHLKTVVAEKKLTMPSKRTLAGERYPSNVWPTAVDSFACALLYGFRNAEKIADYRERDQYLRYEVLERYVEYPLQKGWDTTNCDGLWEGMHQQIFGPFTMVEEPPS